MPEDNQTVQEILDGLGESMDAEQPLATRTLNVEESK